LSDAYLNTMYNSKFVKHFFLEDEILDWREKWSE